jgi:hypothetical protein
MISAANGILTAYATAYAKASAVKKASAVEKKPPRRHFAERPSQKPIVKDIYSSTPEGLLILLVDICIF